MYCLGLFCQGCKKHMIMVINGEPFLWLLFVCCLFCFVFCMFVCCFSDRGVRHVYVMVYKVSNAHR